MKIIEYHNYHYEYEDEIEPEENYKRFHEIYCVVQNIKVTIGSVPLSPYSVMTQELWEMWIQADRPTRDMMGGHHPEDIQRYWQKLYDEALDNILLGDNNDNN